MNLKINCKSDELLTNLRRLARIAADVNYNYRFIAKDGLFSIYAQSSSMYARINMFDVEIIEEGDILVPIKILTLLPERRSITLEYNKEQVVIKFPPRSRVTINTIFKEPDYVSILKQEPKWSQFACSRLKDITYAADKDINYKEQLRFIDGYAICSDGINTAIYDTQYFMDECCIRAADYGKFGHGNATHLFRDDRLIWIGDGESYVAMSSGYSNIPEILKSLLTVTEKDLSSYCETKKDNFLAYSSIIQSLSESKDHSYCIIEGDVEGIRIVPRGNEYGDANLDIGVSEVFGTFRIGIGAKALLKALVNCNDSIKFGVYDLEGFELICIIDGEINHFITPVRIN